MRKIKRAIFRGFYAVFSVDLTVILCYNGKNIRATGGETVAFEIEISTAGKTATITAEKGEKLIDILSRNGFSVPAACGGRGVCGKCAVRLLEGGFDGVTPDGDGLIKSCRATVRENARAEIKNENGEGLTLIETENLPEGRFAAAVDIGTTTLAAAVLTENGDVKKRSRLNPQSSYGADVISRITACENGGLADLQSLVCKAVGEMLTELSEGRKFECVTVCGNAVMLHIFAGISPVSMGSAPFETKIDGALELDGEKYGINTKKLILLPGVSAFVGSDTVAGIYAIGLYKSQGNILFIDMGTNAETVLKTENGIICSSAAAGPALEGAGTECGTGGVNGAVCRVEKRAGGFEISTIGDEKADGICLSGLLDAVALMLENGVVDSSGFMKNDRFYLTDGVYVSAGDIRQFQLAKSALVSCSQCLLEQAGKTAADLDEIILSGGAGFYLNPASALKTGLLPDVDTGVIRSCGNTALEGALRCAASQNALEEVKKIAHLCKTVDLAGSASFAGKFIENMAFGNN